MDLPPIVVPATPTIESNLFKGLHFSFASWTPSEQSILTLDGEHKIPSLTNQSTIRGGGPLRKPFPLLTTFWKLPDSQLHWFGMAYPFYFADKTGITAFPSQIFNGKLRIETQSRVLKPSIEPQAAATQLATEATTDPAGLVGVLKNIDLRTVTPDWPEKDFFASGAMALSGTIQSIGVDANKHLLLNLQNISGGKAIIELDPETWKCLRFTPL